MVSVETSLEPPVREEVSDGGKPTAYIHVSITEPDGTTRQASAAIPVDSSDAEFADALLMCLRGLGSMRGPGLAAAIQSRIGDA